MSETREYYALQTRPGVVLHIYHLPPFLQHARDLRQSLPDFRPFKNVTMYLEDQIEVSEAVDRLTRPIERVHDGETTSSDTGLLLGTWQTFNNIVEQIPHTDDAHLRLAQLLVAIRSRKGDRVIEYEGELWRDLPMYHPSSHGPFETPTNFIEMLNARDFYHGRNSPDEYGGEDKISEQYVNECAFLARLIHLPEAPPSCQAFALLALSGALETDLSPRGLDLNVPGAAVWILYAGDHLLRCEKEWLDPRSSVESFRVSKETFTWPASNMKGFCRERWNLWRNSFAWVTDMEGVLPETRVIAMRAADEMVRLEQELESAEDMTTSGN